MYLVKSIIFAGFLLEIIPNRSMSNLKSSLGPRRTGHLPQQHPRLRHDVPGTGNQPPGSRKVQPTVYICEGAFFRRAIENEER